jgi:uncharacterized protein YoxC
MASKKQKLVKIKGEEKGQEVNIRGRPKGRPKKEKNARKRMIAIGVIEKKKRGTKIQRTMEHETKKMMGTKKETPPILSKELFESITPFSEKLNACTTEVQKTTKHVRSIRREVKRERSWIDELKGTGEVSKKLNENNKKLLELCHRMKDKIDELQRQLNTLNQQHLQMTNSTFQILSEQTIFNINNGSDTLVHSYVT